MAINILGILLSQPELVSCSIQGSNCCFLTCIQVSQETDKMVWYSHLFKNFPQFTKIHIVKGFGIVNETEIDVSLEFSSFLYDPVNVCNSISGSSSFSNSSLDIWKFFVLIMLKPSMADFKCDLTSMGDDWNCPMVRTFFGTTLLENWNEDWPFLVLWPLPGLPDLFTCWMQYLDGIIL